jgi:HTH-type transcriptional regulator/antitoxin HigA
MRPNFRRAPSPGQAPQPLSYEAALAEVERLWGAKSGTTNGDHLDVLATLIDAYEVIHYPMDPPDPIEAI